MNNISMKNVIMGSVLAVAAVTSLSANAVTICAGAEAKNGASVATGSFVKVAFTPKCSANVFLDGNDKSSTVYNVSSGSAKGKKIFAGSTVGGAVAVVPGDCPSDGCTATLVTAKVDAAEGS